MLTDASLLQLNINFDTQEVSRIGLYIFNPKGRGLRTRENGFSAVLRAFLNFIDQSVRTLANLRVCILVECFTTDAGFIGLRFTQPITGFDNFMDEFSIGTSTRKFWIPVKQQIIAISSANIVSAVSSGIGFIEKGYVIVLSGK